MNQKEKTQKLYSDNRVMGSFYGLIDDHIHYHLGVHNLPDKDLVISYFKENIFPIMENKILPNLFKIHPFLAIAAIHIIQEGAYCKYHTKNNGKYHTKFNDNFKKVRCFLAESLVATEPCVNCGKNTMKTFSYNCTDAKCKSCDLRYEVKTSIGKIENNFKGGRVSGVDIHSNNKGCFSIFTMHGCGFVDYGNWTFSRNKDNIVNGIDKTTTTIYIKKYKPFPKNYKSTVDNVNEEDIKMMTSIIIESLNIFRNDKCTELIGTIYNSNRINPIQSIPFLKAKKNIEKSFLEFRDMIYSNDVT